MYRNSLQTPFLDEAEIFDVLTILGEEELPEGVARIPGRCQSQTTPDEDWSAYSLNENASLHQLSAGIFYNTFPEDFSILTVIRLAGKLLRYLWRPVPPYGMEFQFNLDSFHNPTCQRPFS